MRITANTKAVQLIDAEEFLSGAYNDITIDVELSEEYKGLTSFVTFNDEKTLVIAGKVSTPCLREGLCRVGVYAVNIDDNNVVLRYSPKPVDILITTGTWNNQIAESNTPTASEAEKIYTLIDKAIEAGQLKGDKGEPFKYSDFTPEQLEGLRGPQGKPGPKGQKGDSYILTDADKTEIAQKVKLPTKTSELENDSNFVSDANYVHTDNNYTEEEKTKLGSLSNYDDTAIKKQISNKQDKLSDEQLENISAVPNKIDQSQVGNGLKFADEMLSVDINDKLKKSNSKFELIQTVVFEQDKSSTVLWRKPVNADYVGLSEIMIICELYGNSGGIEEFSYFMGNDGKSSNELILFRLPRSFAEDGKYYKSISKGLFTQQGFIPEFNKFGNNKFYPQIMNQDNTIYSSVFSQNSDYITTLKLNTDSTAKSIGAGTKIYIWGVKKYE